MIGSLVVFYFSAMISLIVFSTVTESMNAMFVFYSLEYEMQLLGLAVEITTGKENLELCYSSSFTEEFVPIGSERCRRSSEMSGEPIQLEDTPTQHPEVIREQHRHRHEEHLDRPSKLAVPKIAAYRPSVAPRQIALLFSKKR